MPSKLPPPDECANCGATLPRGARACPECGADERTGWRENSIYDGLDLPESAFEDELNDDNVRRPNATPQISGVPWYWWLVGALLVVALILSSLAVI